MSVFLSLWLDTYVLQTQEAMETSHHYLLNGATLEKVRSRSILWQTGLAVQNYKIIDAFVLTVNRGKTNLLYLVYKDQS